MCNKWCMYCDKSIEIELDDGSVGYICYSSKDYFGVEIMVNADDTCSEFSTI